MSVPPLYQYFVTIDRYKELLTEHFELEYLGDSFEQVPKKAYEEKVMIWKRKGEEGP
jgi:hypothetical protein